MTERLDYWVFTSGEDGVHGLDWGVKYSSPVLGDRLQLDIKYRALLNDFSLAPSIERPEHGNDTGLLLLPWENGGALLGIIFQGIDHQGRPNTSTVICKIPSGLNAAKSVNEIVSVLWKCNDLAAIAKIGSKVRPEFLTFKDDLIVNGESLIKWPDYNKGYIYINGALKEIMRAAAPVSKNVKNIKEVEVRQSGKIKSLIGIAAVLIIAGAAAVYFMNGDNHESDITDVQIQENVSAPENFIPDENETVSQNVAADDKITPVKAPETELELKPETKPVIIQAIDEMEFKRQLEPHIEDITAEQGVIYIKFYLKWFSSSQPLENILLTREKSQLDSGLRIVRPRKGNPFSNFTKSVQEAYKSNNAIITFTATTDVNNKDIDKEAIINAFIADFEKKFFIIESVE